MTPDERSQLADLLRSARQRLGFSVREVASRAGVDMGTVSLIERCKIAQPRPDTIRAIAAAVRVPLVDIYAAVHWVRADELPSLRPYMRAKYQDLTDDAIKELERYIDKLAGPRSGGPQAHEDESPEDEYIDNPKGGHL